MHHAWLRVGSSGVLRRFTTLAVREDRPRNGYAITTTFCQQHINDGRQTDLKRMQKVMPVMDCPEVFDKLEHGLHRRPLPLNVE